MNKQVELPEFVFNSVYVDLQYDEICLIFTAGSVCLCDVCSRPWSVCEVVLVLCVDVVVAVTVMRVLLHVRMLRQCEGDDNAAVGDGRGVVVVSACGWYTWFRYII